MAPSPRATVMSLLENDPENACVGCGPANSGGMHLAFERTQDGAAAAWRAEGAWQGFPGRIHSAALYLGLIESMNWALYAKTHRMGLPTRTSALEMTKRVDVGAMVRFEAKLGDADLTRAHCEATASVDGVIVARLDRDYALVDEKTFLDRMGYEGVPTGYEGVFPRE